MLIGDQVLCDCCGNDMGRLHNLPVPQPDLLPDLRVPPYSATCPDCSSALLIVVVELAV